MQCFFTYFYFLLISFSLILFIFTSTLYLIIYKGDRERREEVGAINKVLKRNVKRILVLTFNWMVS